MTAIEATLHSPGIKIYRVKGSIAGDDIEIWRDEVEAFIKENSERNACGLLIDMIEAESISTDALDGLMDILGDPDEVLDEEMRIRFALIGVKPFTQRFFRESMSQNSMKNFRARFFHEVAEEEALAWLQAMVTTATKEAGITDEATPAEKETPAKKDKEGGKDTKSQPAEGGDAKDIKKDGSKPEAADKKAEEKKAEEKIVEKTKAEKKADPAGSDKKKSGLGALLNRQAPVKEKAPDKT